MDNWLGWADCWLGWEKIIIPYFTGSVAVSAGYRKIILSLNDAETETGVNKRTIVVNAHSTIEV